MTSTLIAGPGEEPVTLAAAKAWCRIDGTDEDALVGALIAAARLNVESTTSRALVTQSWRLTVECPPGLVVPLPVVPVIEVTAATVDGNDIDVIVQGDSVLLPETVSGTLVVDYTTGYGGASEVPADLTTAVLTLVAFWFEYRDSVAAATPAGFDRLIAGYRRVRL
jgi:hypothetical protein